jgi:hypothetical protein
MQATEIPFVAVEPKIKPAVPHDLEAALDEALAESFPASDPPAVLLAAPAKKM